MLVSFAALLVFAVPALSSPKIHTVVEQVLSVPTELDAADLNHDGLLDLIVTDHGYERIIWFQNQGQGAFAKHEVIFQGHGSRQINGVTPVDINGDGLVDIALVNPENRHQVLWIENQGGVPTSFASPTLLLDTETESMDGIVSLVVVDVNQDELQDFIIAQNPTTESNGSKSISVFVNNGEGHASSGSNVTCIVQGFSSGGWHDISVVISEGADIDSNGVPDFFAAWYSRTSSFGGVAWYRNHGDGANFTETFISELAANLVAIHPCDVDLDNHTDLVGFTEYGLHWYRNIDGQNFSAVQDVITTGGRVVHTAIGDVNGDGYPDILWTTVSPDTFEWVQNNGDGVFSSVFPVSSQVTQPGAMVVAPFTEYFGAMDCFVVRGNLKTIYFLSNNREAPFTFIWEPYQALGAYWSIPADLNNDGAADILIGSQEDHKVAWFPNDGNGVFHEMCIISDASRDVVHVAAVDITGDGWLDVLSASRDDDTIAWYENLQNGSFSARRVVNSASRRAYSVAAVDLDNDTMPDIIGASPTNREISWYPNNGQPWSRNRVASGAGMVLNVAVADIDMDGLVDILGASYSPGGVSWYRNVGGSFASETNVVATNLRGAEYVSVADLNADGWVDVLSASSGDDTIAWYPNEQGNFNSQFRLSTTADGATCAIGADLDEDGLLDVVSSSQDDHKVAWFKNLGDGNFSDEIILTISASRARSVSVADLNGDNHLDVVVSCPGQSKIMWIDLQLFASPSPSPSSSPSVSPSSFPSISPSSFPSVSPSSFPSVSLTPTPIAMLTATYTLVPTGSAVTPSSGSSPTPSGALQFPSGSPPEFPAESTSTTPPAFASASPSMMYSCGVEVSFTVTPTLPFPASTAYISLGPMNVSPSPSSAMMYVSPQQPTPGPTPYYALYDPTIIDIVVEYNAFGACGPLLCTIESEQKFTTRLPTRLTGEGLCYGNLKSFHPPQRQGEVDEQTVLCYDVIGAVWRKFVLIPTGRIHLGALAVQYVSSNSTVTLPDGNTNGALLLNGEDTLRIAMPPFLSGGVVSPTTNVLAGKFGNFSLVSMVHGEEEIFLPQAFLPNQHDETTLMIPSAASLFRLCNATTHDHTKECPLRITFRMDLELARSELHDPIHARVVGRCPPQCDPERSIHVVSVVRRCLGFHIGPECLDPAKASEYNCGFGFGASCQACPIHAACPGGERAWPASGYWTPTEASTTIERCPPPAERRCLGWSQQSNSPSCGMGYDNSTPLCGACASGFMSIDGICTTCPVDSREITSQLFTVLGVVVGSILVFFAATFVVLYRIFRISKLPVSKSLPLRISTEISVWLVSSLQVLIQLTRVPIPGLQPFLREVFTFFQVLESDITATVPSECINGSPFTYGIVMGTVSVSAVLLFGAIGLCRARRRCQKTVMQWIQFMSCSGALISYGPVLAKAFIALDCVESFVYESANGKVEYVPTMVWRPSTKIICYEGEHLAAAIVSWTSLAVTGLGLPLTLTILTCIHVRKTVPSYAARKHETILSRSDMWERRRQYWAACCSLPESEHSKLRQDRGLSAVFGFGQPWLRPATVWFTLAISAATFWVSPHDQPLERLFSLGGILFVSALLCWLPLLRFDHKWSAWKWFPRGFGLFISGLLVLLQSLLVLEHPSSSTLSFISVSLFVCIVAQPLITLAGFLFWAFNFTTCARFWGIGSPQMEPKKAHKLVKFAASNSQQVDRLVTRYGENVVASAVQSDDFERTLCRAETELQQQFSSSPAKPRHLEEIGWLTNPLACNRKVAPLLHYRAQESRSKNVTCSIPNRTEYTSESDCQGLEHVYSKDASPTNPAIPARSIAASIPIRKMFAGETSVANFCEVSHKPTINPLYGYDLANYSSGSRSGALRPDPGVGQAAGSAGQVAASPNLPASDPSIKAEDDGGESHVLYSRDTAAACCTSDFHASGSLEAETSDKVTEEVIEEEEVECLDFEEVLAMLQKSGDTSPYHRSLLETHSREAGTGPKSFQVVRSRNGRIVVQSIDGKTLFEQMLKRRVGDLVQSRLRRYTSELARQRSPIVGREKDKA